jgi:negative regulator of flagellin synthesis FlgM
MVIKSIIGDQNPYTNEKIKKREPTDLQRTQQGTTKSSGETADRVVLSSEARLRGAALQSANEAPDVRRKKVDELKRQVQDGTYKPDLKKAAANLIRDDLDFLA